MLKKSFSQFEYLYILFNVILLNSLALLLYLGELSISRIFLIDIFASSQKKS
jgi:hypothetical protein